jgi:hypothetical protein
MRDDFGISNCELFAAYAGDDLEKWKAIIGQQISYERYGRGTVISVYRNEHGNLRIKIRFDKGEEKLWDPIEGYGKFFSDCTLPEGLVGIEALRERLNEKKRKEAEAEKERQRKLEEEARNREEFARLKKKYSVEEYLDEDPKSPLFTILCKIDGGDPEAGDPLDKDDKDFIERIGLCQLFDYCYEEYGDAWYAIRASACWRNKGEPERALNSVEGVQSDDPKCLAAIRAECEAAHEEIRRQEEEAEEAEAREEFARLKKKYGVEEYPDKSLTSPLFMILLKIDSEDPLDKKDKKFISDNQLCQLFDSCYKKYCDPWYAAEASACWRKKSKPKQALKSTEGVKSAYPGRMAAILTTRGAAFADLEKLPEAEDCAREAIEYQPESYHPYNLLGRIYCKKGLPEQGAEYFNEAKKRGAPAKEQEEFIKGTFQEVDEGTRAEVARWLLKKDPKRYAWAKRYLDEKPEG